jgi:hemerythrin
MGRQISNLGGEAMEELVITFDDNLITGNKTIDEQHRELIDRIQQFVDACKAGDGKVKAIKMLDYLDEYTIYHFGAEEALQKEVGYPELAKHQQKHEEFKQTIQKLYDYLDEYEGPNEQFIQMVKTNVVDWLFGHIKTFDRSVAEFIFIRENPDRN